MTDRVRVSSRNLITIPVTVRKKLGIEKGDYLLVDVRDGVIVIVPEPCSYTNYLLGLDAEVWDGIDAQEYVNRERDSWES